MKHRLSFVALLCLLSVVTLSGCHPEKAGSGNTAAHPQPPVAAIKPRVFHEHGYTRTDDYFWLRERGSDEVMNYLRAEQEYTDAWFEPTKALEETLYREILGRIEETDESAPYPEGGYFYYTRTEAGKQYPYYCRKKGSLDAPEEILLDQNTLAEGHEQYSIYNTVPSPDQNWLVFSVDLTGDWRTTLHIKNLLTGEILEETIDGADGGVAWMNDNRHFCYVWMDPDTFRSSRVFMHEIGTAQSADRLLYEDVDEGMYVGMERARSGEYILMNSGNYSMTEYHYLSADLPDGNAQCVVPRRPGVEYSVHPQGKWFYIRTNENAPDFRLMRVPVGEFDVANWEEVLPHKSGRLLSDVQCFRNHIAVVELSGGLPRLRILRTDDGAWHDVSFPESVYGYMLSENHVYDTTKIRLDYTSMITPNTVYDYDMNERRFVQLKQDTVRGFDKSKYVTERVWAVAPDGVKVPASLVYRKGLKRDGRNPLLLYSYGAYGYSTDPYFSVSRLSLLDRGWVFVLAHIRGGSEMGRDWYEQGRLLHKRNTFTDFIAVAEHLCAEGYTSPERTAIMGGSAGGLLMGAVVNMKPEQFGACIAEVPFVDVINTMLDETLPLTVPEYEQWGNPNEKEYYDYMMSYSPYDNVEAKDYPALLVLTGLNDSAVQYWEPAKWVAKLRALKTDNNPLLFNINFDAGHHGSSGRYNQIRETAKTYAFLVITIPNQQKRFPSK